MARPKKPWSKTVEECGVAIRVYERAPGSVLYREARDAEGQKDRRSLGHRDRALAEAQARELARRLAEYRHAGHLGPITLGLVLRLYFQHRGPLLSPTRRKNAETQAALIRAQFGDAFRVEDLSQTHVDLYVAARRSGTLQPVRRGGKREKGVRDGTVGNDLAWLSTVFNWAHAFKQGGRRLMGENPLRDVEWPREKNPRRPIASEDRFQRTLAHADAVEPSGRFRCILTLARYTGRRETAICSLRASDVLLSQAQVRAALAATGQDESLTDHMPWGALRWRPETDKLGFEEVTPISRPAREALETYLRAQPRVGDAPLFPSAKNPAKPVDKGLAGNWVVSAEKRAGLPKLERGLFHPYRRLFAVEGKHLPDTEVAKAGGWRDLGAMKRSYQRPEAVGVLRVVESVGWGHTLDTPPAPTLSKEVS